MPLTINFAVRPLLLDKLQARFLVMVFEGKIPTTTDLLPDTIKTLREYGLILTSPQSDEMFTLTAAGKGLVELMPPIIHSGRCSNCGNPERVAASVSGIELFFTEPNKKCSLCGSALFKPIQDKK